MIDAAIATGLHLRAAKPEDQAFITSTFVSSLAMVKRPLPLHKRDMLVDRVLDKAGVKVAVACELGAGGRILGWLAYSPMPSATVVLYCYVRNQARKQGIANALAIHAGLNSTKPVVFTLEGPSASWLRAKHPSAIPMPILEFLA